MANRLKKDDLVVVIAGRDKGTTGRILKINTDSDRVIVEGVNRVKRHSKPTPQAPEGGIIEKEASLSYSNVMIMCDKCNKPTRISMVIEDSGEKYRACKRCGDVLEAKKK